MSVLVKRTYKPADERREQILACALEVFGQKGYHGASIADVCARAGIGRATLYQYFEDKRDVLQALADRLVNRIVEAVRARRPLSIPQGFRPTDEQTVQFVEARFAGILHIVFEDAASARLLLRVGRGVDGVMDGILANVDEVVLHVVESDLEAAMKAGVVRPLDARFVARFFVGGIEKVVLMHLDEGRPIDVLAIAREAALLQMCGALASPRFPVAMTPPPKDEAARGPRRTRTPRVPHAAPRKEPKR